MNISDCCAVATRWGDQVKLFTHMRFKMSNWMQQCKKSNTGKTYCNTKNHYFDRVQNHSRNSESTWNTLTPGRLTKTSMSLSLLALILLVNEPQETILLWEKEYAFARTGRQPDEHISKKTLFHCNFGSAHHTHTARIGIHVAEGGARTLLAWQQFWSIICILI